MEDVKLLRICSHCRGELEFWGIRHRACVMVLLAMVMEPRLTYREALKLWAEYEFDGAWPPERWHSEICYHMLKAWVTEPPEQFFDELAQKVRKYEN